MRKNEWACNQSSPGARLVLSSRAHRAESLTCQAKYAPIPEFGAVVLESHHATTWRGPTWFNEGFNKFKMLFEQADHRDGLKMNIEASGAQLTREVIDELNQVTEPPLKVLGPSFDYYEHPDNDRTSDLATHGRLAHQNPRSVDE